MPTTGRRRRPGRVRRGRRARGPPPLSTLPAHTDVSGRRTRFCGQLRPLWTNLTNGDRCVANRGAARDSPIRPERRVVHRHGPTPSNCRSSSLALDSGDPKSAPFDAVWSISRRVKRRRAGGRRSGTPARRRTPGARSGLLPLGSVRGQCQCFGGVSVARGDHGEAGISVHDGHPWGQVLAECPILAAPREIDSSCVRLTCSPSRGRPPVCGSGGLRDGFVAVARHLCRSLTAGLPEGCSRQNVLVRGYC
jgi:hypothetical protein